MMENIFHLKIDCILKPILSKEKRKYETANEIPEKSISNWKKKLENAGNVDIHKLMTLHGCVNILMNVKFVLVNFKALKKFQCFRRDRFVGACNNCPSIKTC